MIESPFDFNETSGTFFSSGRNGHVCEWNLTTLKPFDEFELSVKKLESSGENIKASHIIVNIVSVH